MIINTLPNKSGNPESLKNNCNRTRNFSTYFASSLRGFAEGALEVALFTVLFQVISKAGKILVAVWETFLYENKWNYDSYKFSFKFAFVPFSFFSRNQKQESNFQKVGGLVTTNICFLFIESKALFQRHTGFNTLLEGNFLTCYSCSYYSSIIPPSYQILRL